MHKVTAKVPLWQTRKLGLRQGGGLPWPLRSVAEHEPFGSESEKRLLLLLLKGRVPRLRLVPG